MEQEQTLFESYKKRPKLDEHYDVICIGSGLGSLCTASLLARNGKKVLVCEKHYTPGGYTHVFTRNDYEWDVGLHYVGDMDRKGSALRIIFEYITDRNLKWADMGEVYDRVLINGKTFEYLKGLSKWKERMKIYFPTEQDAIAIDKYVEILFAVNNAGKSFYMQKAMPKLVQFFTKPFLNKSYQKYYSQTTKELLDSLSDNEELKAVLAAQFGDYGMPPSQSSFVIHAAVALHYMNGGFYPVGGSEEIFNTIMPSILNTGGKTIISAEVKEILVENGKAIGVLMADGKKITADIIVSGVGAHLTFEKLLNTENQKKIKFSNDLKNLPPSYGHFSLYIGLQHTATELNLPKANYWIYPNGNDHDAAVEKFMNDYNEEFPVVYISFPSAKNPKFDEKYPGRATIEIISVANYDWFTEWENSRWKKRGENYETFKEKIAQRLLAHLYKVEPQVEGKIDTYELSTPLSTKNFCSYQKGEIYGLTHSPQRFDSEYLKPQTPIKNLYLTGQDIVTVGIAGALMSGVLTTSAILGKNIMNDIIQYAKSTPQ
ncbi:MAG TPA: NAD(P)/FAD-dependent oxidoreductase [Chitinophagales bacterium]|nr:NAD(P)/FAD-dependent oxidoreductase [Chitinophagales bacterium]MCB0511994.1 NAD(P)/FAD-dependent oxidoreductase [Bacteroidota bacterium]HMU97444.1 NAD(P)/FAD-dependent oxidoreductase [Chitinophagales bacterium]HMV01965.1 NAD(P)/FAD-dependent oxidoreductase [Chitinophagales bacterium]HMW93390.1 NAD(P)/FAD-dependent oxidoreductase [Chitinophagales bacterium]